MKRIGNKPAYVACVTLMGLLLVFTTVGCFDSDYDGKDYGDAQLDEANSVGPQTGFEPGDEPIHGVEVRCEIPTQTGVYMPRFYEVPGGTVYKNAFVRDNRLYSVQWEQWGNGEDVYRLVSRDIYTACPANYSSVLDKISHNDNVMAVFFDELRDKLYVATQYDVVAINLGLELNDPERKIVYQDVSTEHFGSYGLYPALAYFFHGNYGYVLGASFNGAMNSIHRFIPPTSTEPPKWELLSATLPTPQAKIWETKAWGWDSDSKLFVMFGLFGQYASDTIEHPITFDPETETVEVLTSFSVPENLISQMSAVYFPKHKRFYLTNGPHGKALSSFDYVNGFQGTKLSVKHTMIKAQMAVDGPHGLIVLTGARYSGQQYSIRDDFFLIKP